MSPPDRKDKAKAVPIVLEHVRALSEKIRPRIDARMQDKLNCGLARLGLAKPSPEACARTEARQFVRVIEDFANTPEAERSRWSLAHACYHLESCSGDCAEEIEILWSVDWSRFPAPDPQRVAAVKQCPEFGKLLLAGPVNETEQRARVWFNKHVREFSARACKLLDVSERARLACAMSRLGVPLEPSACGPQPDGCAPVSAKRK